MKEMLCLLYHEAKKNVLTGRYPLTQDECDDLAGLEVLITEEEQREQEHREPASVIDPIQQSLDYFRFRASPMILRFCLSTSLLLS